MKNKQNKFYTSISKYYSEIFPFNPVQLDFVESCVGELSGKIVLDIGCATGELAYQLAKNGANVTGIDLNEELLNQAITKKSQPNLEFRIGDMLNLESDFQTGQFDAVLCFGNTLVHLETPELVKKMLTGAFNLLKPGGMLLLQILNYDYILSEKITELPIIETDKIKFIRKYQIEENNALIVFHTQLELKVGKKVLINETSLNALKSNEIINLLQNAGFTEILLYSNFLKEPFGSKHLPFVVCCIRN